ncbi:metallophosphoesterase family protein [Noviherbaspirillum denitrificans]|uniref:Alkaline phosphatase n=1 Tax=Noviherbaspirillum denitrificans TaxID=1968433 RepID=A0A254T986_9BURK|nr:metallophosphoesterase [Noviherbaspirillum denitrificans]OWW19209.1 alkaline phosphatase [Noviherbaspirillum denitrificans]
MRKQFFLPCTLAFLLAACQSDRQTREQEARAILLPDKGVSLYAAGDIASCKSASPENSGAGKTAALITAGLAQDKDAVVLTLGDNTYPVGLLSEFENCYEPTWGRFKSRTYPSPGNHDYYTPYAAGYYRYFGDAAGPGRRGYYSFTRGSWHIISLNSFLKPAEHSAQLAWLKEELARSTAKCTLAYWHHPLYSSGGHGNDKRMQEAWAMLHAAGADVVLVSHDHDYERFAPQDAEGQLDDARGIRQFVVGTGGAELTPLRFRRSHSEASDNSTFGVLKLVLKEAGYEWEFIPVEKGGFTDRGAALCH